MTSSSRFSIVTYNIHKGFSIGQFRFLLPEMRQALENLNPDFVFLQEVQGEHTKRAKRVASWPEASQSQYLADNSWPYYVYAKNAVYAAGHHGNAMLSKYPFDSMEHVNLSTVTRASRGFLHNQVALGGQTLHLLCVHLGLFKTERLSQCRALMQWISEQVPLNEPLVLAGDFNDWRYHLTEPLFNELGILEAFYSTDGEHARSFPSIKPALCVDRIYFRGVTVESVACLSGKPWQLLSDHLPLFAEFSM